MEPAVQRRGDLRRRRGAAARRPGRSSPASPRPHGSPGRLSIRTTIRQETTMTASATTPTREKAERARENSEYVRSLLNVRQPQFAAALESAARKPLRDHGTVCASSQRSSQPGWGLLAAAGRPTALPAGQTCELRVGPEFFYLGSDFPGAITSTLGLAALVYGLTSAATSQNGVSHWGDTKVVVALTAAVVLLAAFIVIEARSAHALMPLRIFRNRDRSAANLIMLFVGTAMFGMFFFLTIFVQTVWGYSALKTGIAYLPLVTGVMVMAGVSAALVPRIGARPLPQAGCSGCRGSASTAPTPAVCWARCWSPRPGWACCSCR